MRLIVGTVIACSLLGSHFAMAQFSERGELVRRGGFPKVGDSLPELQVFDQHGQVVSTASLKGSYTVLVFGCLT